MVPQRWLATVSVSHRCLNSDRQLFRCVIGTSTVVDSCIGISSVPQRWLATVSVSHQSGPQRCLVIVSVSHQSVPKRCLAAASVSHRYLNGGWQMYRYLIGTSTVVGGCVGISSVPQRWLACRYLTGTSTVVGSCIGISSGPQR